jgi:nucleotide-binding universal stress UspA family protein
MFKRILVPVDFTDKNLSALDRAYQLAKWNKGAVILLHVIEKVEYLSSKEMKTFYQKLEKSAEKKMNQYGKTFAKRHIAFEERIVYGKRAEQIVRFAKEEEVDLIIMSSHRIRPKEKWGTVSYQVAILSSASVLLVK